MIKISYHFQAGLKVTPLLRCLDLALGLLLRSTRLRLHSKAEFAYLGFHPKAQAILLWTDPFVREEQHPSCLRWSILLLLPFHPRQPSCGKYEIR